MKPLMELIQRVKEDVNIVDIVGDMDLYNAYKLKNLVENTVQESKGRKIILNFDQVDHMDSSGLGALIHVHSIARKQGLPIVFTNIHGSVGMVIELARLTAYFPITGTLDEALRQIDQ